jgi:Holin of 3TMs, for gene-transfer release
MAQSGMMGGMTMTAAPPPPVANSLPAGSQGFGGSTAAGSSVTASREYEVAGPITNAIGASDLSAISDIDKSIVHRKMLLEEARFKLEEERERHRMMMELRKEQFREDELRRDEEKEENKQGEHWMKSYWRPAMGWLYMLICAFDFIIAPMLTMAMPVFLKSLGAAQVSYTQWQSLTLANGGLIHLAFGAILGVTAWTRGQEKIAKMG